MVTYKFSLFSVHPRERDRAYLDEISAMKDGQDTVEADDFVE
jgi:hypothetical protein